MRRFGANHLQLFPGIDLADKDITQALSMMIITTGVYITETRADLVMPYISYIPSIALLVSDIIVIIHVNYYITFLTENVLTLQQCYSKLNEFCYWSVKRSPSPTDFAIFLMFV